MLGIDDVAAVARSCSDDRTAPSSSASSPNDSRVGGHRPGEVFSWGITKLAGPTKGIYYNAYVMLDIFSRFIVGCVVHARETAGLAEDFMATVFGVYGSPKSSTQTGIHP